MEETLTPAQRRTLPARQALAAKFVDPEQKSEHYRRLARRSHERRLTLSGDEAATLAHLSDFLLRLVDRDQCPHDPHTVQEGATSGA